MNIFGFLYSSLTVTWISLSCGQNKTFEDVILDFQRDFNRCNLQERLEKQVQTCDDQVVLPVWQVWGGRPHSGPCLQETGAGPCGSVWWCLVWGSSEDPAGRRRTLTADCGHTVRDSPLEYTRDHSRVHRCLWKHSSETLEVLKLLHLSAQPVHHFIKTFQKPLYEGGEEKLDIMTTTTKQQW